ncbi:MAG: MBOAT family protein [Ruminococcaceae bacterium]|nr:MBOAT family protein [Oscillospiraceae bacterium]
MVFSHLLFLYIFMFFLLIAYFAIPNNFWRRGVLTVFSLLFYAFGEPKYVFLMIGLVLTDYIFGRLIACKTSSAWRKTWLVLAVITNLGVLGLFKYLGFFTETVNNIFGADIPVLSLTMPIGISFFTFQTMSYVIDVYREDVPVQKSFPKLLLYVSFFPQLIAGPIVRYKDIEAQLDNRSADIYEIQEGLYRFSIGLAKKVLIADNCGAASGMFYSLKEATVSGQWLGAVFFTLQLYFDFSGYSDMAIGLGRIFGFRFRENFNYPLISGSATEFWRRWHMSLGTFFRDYVYIPLGGNRHNQIRNIFVVWFLTGMWHGASWNFMLWGVYYGILLLIEKKGLLAFLSSVPDAENHPARARFVRVCKQILSHAYCIFITVFGFAIFYFEKGLPAGIGRLFGVGVSGFTDLFTMSVLMEHIWLLIAACVLACPVIPAIGEKLKGKLGEDRYYVPMRLYKTACVILLTAAATVQLVGNSYSPFLYFRF